MKGFDAFAGVIKSGGKTRRAAKMVILNVDHPDIVEFIECKQKEEAKAWALVRAGYDGSGPDVRAYSSIFFQNANNSVRVTDEFMYAVDARQRIQHQRRQGRHARQDLQGARAACARSPTPPGTAAIPACSTTPPSTAGTRRRTRRASTRRTRAREYMFLDDSACNLASLNLLKFAPNGTFDVAAYRHACAVVITAQEILVDNAGYPTETIAQNSHDYRPLGLGYANLGALLMAAGLPYDSDAGRDYAASVTAIMCGEAYLQSARIAEQSATAPRRQPPELTQGQRHRWRRLPRLLHQPRALPRRHPHAPRLGQQHQQRDQPVRRSSTLYRSQQGAWDEALAHGEKFGYRNAQVTVLAPTGTIGFMMDCDTTGIEPDLALVKYKKLVGGGMIKIVNNTVPAALFKLGYTDDQINAIVSYIDATGTIEGAPAHQGRAPRRLRLLASSPPRARAPSTTWATSSMMAAAQPFISGAISKTINMPENAPSKKSSRPTSRPGSWA